LKEVTNARQISPTRVRRPGHDAPAFFALSRVFSAFAGAKRDARPPRLLREHRRDCRLSRIDD